MAGHVLVDRDRCTGCGTCVSVCVYNALNISEGISNVDEEKCLGCGACVPSCPNMALSLEGAGLENIIEQVRGVLKGLKAGPGEPVVLIFACEETVKKGFDLSSLAELPGASNVRSITVRCASSLDPLAVLEAFRSGADVIVVAGYGCSGCEFKDVGPLAEDRMRSLSEAMEEAGLPGRIIVGLLEEPDGEALLKLVEGAIRSYS